MIPISTPVLIGGAAVLAGGAYLLSKKSDTPSVQTPEQLAQSVVAGNSAAVSSAAAAAVQNVQMDGVTAEYNMAREKYRMIAGSYPPQSWTIEMINSWIEEQSRKEEALKQYVAIVSANSEYVTLKNTDNLTYQQIQSLISQTNNEVSAGKEKARVKELAGTAKQLAAAFRATLLAPNYFNLTLEGQNAWDTATLQAMINLSAEGKQYCEYYFEQDGAVKLPGYFNQVKSAWKEYKTIASCIINSNTCNSRTGASTAKEVRTAFQGVSPKAPKVGADGSFANPYPIDPIIAFHLSLV